MRLWADIAGCVAGVLLLLGGALEPRGPYFAHCFCTCYEVRPAPMPAVVPFGEDLALRHMEAVPTPTPGQSSQPGWETAVDDPPAVGWLDQRPRSRIERGADSGSCTHSFTS